MPSPLRSLRSAPLTALRASLPAILIAMLVASTARASMKTTATESFDGTLDEATWRVGTLDQIDPTGGHPGGFLHNPQTDSAVPTPIYVGPAGSRFLGDYRAESVTSLGIDVNVFSASIGVDPTRPISLVLGSDMGTPDDPSDDCEAYVVGQKLPREGSGWKSYTFRVPSAKTTLPPGWVIRGECAGLAENDAWSAVITNVTRVTFPFSDPDTFWYFQIWDLGIDSVRITFRDGSGANLSRPGITVGGVVP